MNIEEAPLVFVVWEDAETQTAWQSKSVIETFKAPLCYTVGWLVHETEKHIILAQTVGTKVLNTDEEDQPGNTWLIPRGMVVAQKTLKLPRIKGL